MIKINKAKNGEASKKPTKGGKKKNDNTLYKTLIPLSKAAEHLILNNHLVFRYCRAYASVGVQTSVQEWESVVIDWDSIHIVSGLDIGKVRQLHIMAATNGIVFPYAPYVHDYVQAMLEVSND